MRKFVTKVSAPKQINTEKNTKTQIMVGKQRVKIWGTHRWINKSSEVSGYWFFNSWSISKKFLHIQSLSENFWNLVSDIHLHATLAKHAINRPASGPSFLKTYSSVACNTILIHCKCAVDCTTLGRNVVNLTLKPKPQIWLQKFGNFWKK